ncbi:MAG: hypothetical protein IT350_16055 [Deltaproteobacteria bacterium]|nr:hypothetical protein [Deltaproteobacteria bacterium]
MRGRDVSWLSMLLLLAASSLLAAFTACTVDAESDDEENDCDGNRAPQIAGPYLVTGGELVDEDTEFSVNEKIGIALDFQDKDCNLGNGQIWASVDGEEYRPMVLIRDNIGCSGFFPDTVLGFDIRLQSGTHEVRMALTDACGPGSEEDVSTTIDVAND